MFGMLVSGRLVQTDSQQVEERKFLFNLPEADNINHVVVFMTGTIPFPDGLGGAVYFSWPSAAAMNWKLLGHITNSKPSAIFRITNLKQDEGSSHPFGQMGLQQNHMAQIGISVESLDQLAQQTPDPASAPTATSSFVEFSQKMLESLYNYTVSFALKQSQMTANPAETYVPLSTLQGWFETFQRKLQLDPNFWKR